jgi:endonuclease YncB( thermonuclease family)
VSKRTIVRDGRVRRVPFFVRLFGFTELRDWLVQAGFAAVAGHDQDGVQLSAASRRLLVVAQR